MGAVAVRVVPRSGRIAVEAGASGVVVRVRSAPEGGRATEEARRALAEALGVPHGRVSLRAGRRARTKLFEIDGMTSEEAEVRLRATRER